MALSPPAPKLGFISTSDVARKLGYTIQHVRLLIRQQKLPAVKFGRDWIIQKEAFVSAFNPSKGKSSNIQEGQKMTPTQLLTKPIAVNGKKTGLNPTVVSLFSGCGGMDLAFKQAGFNILWANDINEFACETYRNYFGDHIVCGNIEEIPLQSIPKADVVIGGFPCQDFSIIWKRPGLSGKRGNLYLSYIKVIEHVQPKIFVAENVRGLMTLDQGRVLEKIVSDFENAGYRVRADLYNFAEYGVPQMRERVLIVGVKNSFGEFFPKPKTTHSKTNFITSGEALKGVKKVGANNEHQNINPKTRDLLNLIPEGGNFSNVPTNHPLYVKGMISHVYRRLDRNKPSTTIIAAGGGGTWGYHYEEPRPLTNRERARLFTFPDDMVFHGSISEVRRQIGNAVPPKGVMPVAESIMSFLRHGRFHQ